MTLLNSNESNCSNLEQTEQNQRKKQLTNWLRELFQCPIDLTSIPSDASVRTYWRFNHQNKTYIGVDSPLPLSENQAYVSVQSQLKIWNIPVPEIIDYNLDNGFFCISDLGSQTLYDSGLNLKSPIVMSHYQTATEWMISWQRTLPSAISLPVFDSAFMRFEMTLFKSYFLESYLKYNLNEVERRMLDYCFSEILKSIAKQPYAFMHRDYHSRNLMVNSSGDLAVIDFQGAQWGPLLYDSASLYNDIYSNWPREQRLELFRNYCEQSDSAWINNQTQDELVKSFDLTTMQRYLKCLGLFCRLAEQGKPDYLQYLPYVWQEVKQTAKRYNLMANNKSIFNIVESLWDNIEPE